jgi:NAD dependent epimerase/dehydratase family enzyme
VAKPAIAIAGSSGLIGSALAAALRAAEHLVLRIVRRTPPNSDELHRNPVIHQSFEGRSDPLCVPHLRTHR